MAESLLAIAEASRKSQSQILRELASRGQKAAGEAIGKSETWVSRFASEQLKTCADLLAVLGLKVVPAEHKCYAPEYIEHLRYFAQIGMAADDGTPPPVPPRASGLSFEEEA
jgi:hypothetical protein